MTDNPTNPPKELAPIWAMIAAISITSESEEFASEKSTYLFMLDKLHEGLLQAIEEVEALSNRIQMSVPRDTQDGPLPASGDPEVV